MPNNKTIDDIIDFHATLQGVAHDVANLLADAISAQDTELLDMLRAELRTIREWIIGNKKSPKAIFDRLQRVQQQIKEIEHRGIQRAHKLLWAKSEEVADSAAKHTGTTLAEALQNGRDIRRKRLKTRLTEEEIKSMLDYKPFVDGKTVGQWFGDLEQKNWTTIFNAVQRGVIEGYTLNTIIQTIQGTKENDFKDGILERNRKSAELLARTAINATANQSRLELYRANADVLDGVQWLGTLDHRTCLICGAFDGKIWTVDKMNEIKVPPAHPNCRCLLVPYIDLGDETAQRPAEVENFDQIAKEQYEAKYPTKSYDALSYEYRRALRYKAIKDYGESTGKPYKQMQGTDFKQYLESQPESFQREWLGKGRYDLYKQGKLTLDMMVNPDTGFKRTIKDLQAKHGVPIRDGWSNSFWDTMGQIKEYNSVKEIAVSPEMAEAMRQNGFRDVDDFANRVNEYVQKNDVLQRIELRHIIQQLAEEPILKNQFETGTSSVFFDPQKRIEFENVLSGRESKTMPPRERPIYGYVGDARHAITYVEEYGQTVVVFNDSVRDRVTFTIGNSSSMQGAFRDDVRAIFNKGRETKLHGGFMKLADDILRGGAQGHTSQWYLEAQIWGCADMRLDVKEIAIGEKDLKIIANNVESGLWQRFKKHMDDAHVPINYYVNLSDEEIRKNTDEWTKIKAYVDRLQINLINLAQPK